MDDSSFMGLDARTTVADDAPPYPPQQLLLPARDLRFAPLRRPSMHLLQKLAITGDSRNRIYCKKSHKTPNTKLFKNAIY